MGNYHLDTGWVTITLISDSCGFSPYFAPACGRHALPRKQNAAATGIGRLAEVLLAIRANLTGRVQRIRGGIDCGGVVREPQRYGRSFVRVQGRKIRGCGRGDLADQAQYGIDGTAMSPPLTIIRRESLSCMVMLPAECFEGVISPSSYV